MGSTACPSQLAALPSTVGSGRSCRLQFRHVRLGLRLAPWPQPWEGWQGRRLRLAPSVPSPQAGGPHDEAAPSPHAAGCDLRPLAPGRPTCCVSSFHYFNPRPSVFTT